MKIILGLISCVLGVLSHFYFVPFDKNKYNLMGCVAGYALCALLYYYIERYLQKDSFYIAKEHKVSQLKDFQRVCVSSNFDPDQKPTPEYVLILEAEHNTDSGRVIRHEQKMEITQFYDTHGYLHRYVAKNLVDDALSGLTKQR
eukprot:403340155